MPNKSTKEDEKKRKADKAPADEPPAKKQKEPEVPDDDSAVKGKPEKEAESIPGQSSDQLTGQSTNKSGHMSGVFIKPPPGQDIPGLIWDGNTLLLWYDPTPLLLELRKPIVTDAEEPTEAQAPELQEYWEARDKLDDWEEENNVVREEGLNEKALPEFIRVARQIEGETEGISTVPDKGAKGGGGNKQEKGTILNVPLDSQIDAVSQTILQR